MTTITIKAPDKYSNFLEDSSEFETIISEVFYDYIEKKQDQVTSQSLNNNPYFHKLNSSLEEKLGKL